MLRSKNARRRAVIAFCSATAMLASLSSQASAKPVPAVPSDPDAVSTTGKPIAPPVEPPIVPAEKRQDLLGQGWQKSGDRLWTTSGDATGLHVMVAEAKTGYSWRTVATLSNAAVETDKWIGNACVTGSGDKAVVVYAPRTFTNKEKLFSRGGFTAIVDLNSGKVQQLPIRTSLAYFNPGCGTGETVALTQGGEEDLGKTALLTVDAGNGTLSKRTELDGQLTSAVPIKDGFAVAGGSGVLKVSQEGKKERLALTKGTPSYLRPDAEGGVVFLSHDDKKVAVQRATGVGKPVATLATGDLGKIGLTSATAGKVFITGTAAKVEALPASVHKIDVPRDSTVSTKAEAVLTELKPTGAPMKPEPQAWHLKAKSLVTGRDLGFTINPADALTPREVEPGHTCAVPRNDPKFQVVQPKPKQVEWAVDMAIYGYLTVQRPANWRGYGLPGYSPQSLFPREGVHGGGAVPAQIMLGIIGQESNMWQASRFALPGESGNPLIGNYYGVDIYDGDPWNDWNVDFSKADCGYGVTQMTDGMRRPGFPRHDGEVQLDNTRQVAIATDYAANVAAGLQLLTKKWNELYDAGVKVHDGDPANIENWFLAAWSYNSGYHQPGEAHTNGAYGLGWGNNPENPRYDSGRGSFGENPTDFARPQFWPYPEKVMGFAANTPWGFEDENTEVPFFRAAVWNGGDGSPDDEGTGAYNRRHVKPKQFTFCNSNNNCVPNGRYVPTDPLVDDDPEHDTGPCAHQNDVGQYDLRCWWHTSTGWKPDNCARTCGFEFIRYDYPDFAAEPADGISFTPYCGKEALRNPDGAFIVDSPVTSFRSCPNGGAVSYDPGTVTFETDGRPAGWADLHQLGTGFNTHTWFANTHMTNTPDAPAEVRAEWTLNVPHRSRLEVFAFIPAHGRNKAIKASYQVHTATGVKTVELNQSTFKNEWASLGTWDFVGNPKVTLSNVQNFAIINQMLVFDALAFLPVDSNREAGDRTTPIRNMQSDMCLSPVDTWSERPAVVQRPCLHDANPKNLSDNWLKVNGQVEIDLGNGRKNYVKAWNIKHRATGKCLAVKDNSAVLGSPAELRTCDQSTRFIGNVQLEVPNTQMALVNLTNNGGLHPAGDSYADGTPIVLGTWSDSQETPPFYVWRF